MNSPVYIVFRAKCVCMSACMYMCVKLYTYACICVYVYVCVYVYIYIWMYVCVYVCTLVCLRTYMRGLLSGISYSSKDGRLYFDLSVVIGLSGVLAK